MKASQRSGGVHRERGFRLCWMLPGAMLLLGGCAETERPEEAGDPEPVIARYVVTIEPTSFSFGPYSPEDPPPETVTRTVHLKGTCETPGRPLPEVCEFWIPGWRVDTWGQLFEQNFLEVGEVEVFAEQTVEFKIHLANIIADRAEEKSLVVNKTVGFGFLPINLPPGFTVTANQTVRIHVSVLPATEELRSSIPEEATLRASPSVLPFQNRPQERRGFWVRNNGKVVTEITGAYLEGPDAHLFNLEGAVRTMMPPGYATPFFVTQITTVEDWDPHTARVVVSYAGGQSLRIPIATKRSF